MKVGDLVKNITKENIMKRGDLVYERYGDRYGVILFVDDENPDCFGIMFVGACDWCFGYSEDLEAVCK